MDINMINTNAEALVREMQWLSNIIDVRMKLYYSKPCDYTSITDVERPNLVKDLSLYAKILRYYNVSFEERVILAMAMAPHVQPHVLDIFFTKNSEYERGFTEFGGIKGQNHGGFLPTGETIAFLLAPNDFQFRFRLYQIFGEDHFFSKFKILKLIHPQQMEPFLSGALSIEPEYLSLFTVGSAQKPDYNSNFPAKLINTKLDWEDLVLDDAILEEVYQIRDWIQHGDTLLNDWGMAKKVKPGFRSLFYGPPGTGKTLTASLLGKASGLDVYRIDLSQVVSKYIGETEKNLKGVFDQAESKNWILFFDEADALFGKRTATSSSNDRHANQEVSYLLQRIEDYPGIIILASNMKENLDEAFSRRFQTMIYFPMPGKQERYRLWMNTFSSKSKLEEKVDMHEIAAKYELAGGAIINVVRYCSIKALKQGTNIITYRDIMEGIRKEFGKDGRIV